MVFKLTDSEQREQALAIEGAHLFDPMGGRPMKEWVCLTEHGQPAWLDIAAEALDYVRSRPT